MTSDPDTTAAQVGAQERGVASRNDPSVLSGSDRASLWDSRWAGALVVAIAVLVFAPTLVLGRVSYDDLWLWGDDSPLRQLDLETLWTVFGELDVSARRPLGLEYLPVRDVAVMLDMAAWGTNEQGPHLTQLVLYAATVYGLGTLLVRVGMPRTVAWTATLLWAVHPLHAESVAWLSERKGVLAGLWVVACGHAWIRYRTGEGKPRFLVLAALAAVAGVWSKAPAMFGPTALAALDLALLPRDRRRWVAVASLHAAVALAAIPVVAVARGARVIDETYQGGHGRVVSALGALGHYVLGTIGLRSPAVAYHLQSDGPSSMELALGLAALTTAAIATWWLLRRRRARTSASIHLGLAALGWSLVWFVPICHLVIPVHIIAADRFVYLWLLGPALGLALALAALGRTVSLAVLGATVCTLAVLTLRAEAAWTSSRELFARAHASDPRDPRIAENYANALAAGNDPDTALAVLDARLRHEPDNGYLLAAKARVLDLVGERDRALEISTHAAASGRSSVMSQHAARLREHGRSAEALPFIERAVARQPRIALYARMKATILIDLRRYAEAEPVARTALSLEPWSALHHFILAIVLIELGRATEARPHLQAASRDPQLARELPALMRRAR